MFTASVRSATASATQHRQRCRSKFKEATVLDLVQAMNHPKRSLSAIHVMAATCTAPNTAWARHAAGMRLSASEIRRRLCGRVTSPRRAAKNVSVNMPSEPPASGTGKRSPAAGSKEYPRERAQKGARGASVTRVVFTLWPNVNSSNQPDFTERAPAAWVGTSAQL
jgi:hypothetical protein